MGQENRNNPLSGGLDLTNSDALECSPFSEDYSNFTRGMSFKKADVPAKKLTATIEAKVASPKGAPARSAGTPAIRANAPIASRPSTIDVATPSRMNPRPVGIPVPRPSSISNLPLIPNTTPVKSQGGGGGTSPQGGGASPQGGGGSPQGGGGGSQGGGQGGGSEESQQEEQPISETSEGSEQQETTETTDTTESGGSTETTESTETTTETTEGGDEESSNIGGTDTLDTPFYKTMWFWGAIAGGIGAYLYAKSKGKNLLAFTLLGSGVVGGVGYGVEVIKNKNADGGTTSGGGDGKSKDSGDTKSVKLSGLLEDKVAGGLKTISLAMLSAMGMPKADVDKATKEMNSKLPEIKAKVKQKITTLSGDEQKALGEYVDYSVAQIPANGVDLMSMAQDQKKQKEAEAKTTAFMASLKKKYPNADMNKVKAFMEG